MVNNSPKQKRYQHEGTDASGRSIVWAASVLVVILIFIGFIVFGLLTYFGGRQSAAPDKPWETVREKQIPSLPHLQAKSSIALQKLQQEKEGWLHSYGWIDKKKGIVHIPIERAMERVVEEKMPAHSKKPLNNGRKREERENRRK